MKEEERWDVGDVSLWGFRERGGEGEEEGEGEG